MRKNKVCAFCEIKTDFTREHIFPSGIIDFFQVDLLTISDKNDSFFSKETLLLKMFVPHVTMKYYLNLIINL